MKKFLIALFSSIIVAVAVCSAYLSIYPQKLEEKPVYDTTIKLLDFNIRTSAANDKQNSWYYRKDAFLSTVKSYGADLMGFQEVCGDQYDALIETFGAEYGYFGYYRSIGTQFEVGSVPYEILRVTDEANPIFYRKERFDLIEQKCFWLNEDPEVADFGWDADCVRLCTIVVLYDKYAEQTVIYANTHLDHRGKEARKEGVKLIKRKLAEYDCAQKIVTGDFNVFEGNEVYKLMSPEFSDVKYLAADSDEGTTFASYTDEITGKPIDFTFVSGGLSAKKYKIIRDRVAEQAISDHYGLYSELIYA